MARPDKIDALAHVDAFNSNLRVLLKGLGRLYPDDPEIARHCQRASLAMSTDPLMLLRAAGPGLVRHHAEITKADKSGDDEYFLKLAYDGELKAADADRADADRLIAKIKAKWPGLAEPQKKGFRRAVCRMLDAYLEYCEAAGV
jgi:hypothetical protein